MPLKKSEMQVKVTKIMLKLKVNLIRIKKLKKNKTLEKLIVSLISAICNSYNNL
jgi:hypothetical protein